MSESTGSLRGRSIIPAVAMSLTNLVRSRRHRSLEVERLHGNYLHRAGTVLRKFRRGRKPKVPSPIQSEPSVASSEHQPAASEPVAPIQPTASAPNSTREQESVKSSEMPTSDKQQPSNRTASEPQGSGKSSKKASIANGQQASVKSSEKPINASEQQDPVKSSDKITHASEQQVPIISSHNVVDNAVSEPSNIPEEPAALNNDTESSFNPNELLMAHFDASTHIPSLRASEVVNQSVGPSGSTVAFSDMSIAPAGNGTMYSVPLQEQDFTMNGGLPNDADVDPEPAQYDFIDDANVASEPAQPEEIKTSPAQTTSPLMRTKKPKRQTQTPIGGGLARPGAQLVAIKYLSPGAMGRVTLARVAGTDALLIVKNVEHSDDQISEQTSSQRIQDNPPFEYRHLLFMLRHRNILATYGYFFEPYDALPWAIMTEYCEEGAVDAFLYRFRKHDGQIPEIFIYHFLASMSEALAYLHFGLYYAEDTDFLVPPVQREVKELMANHPIVHRDIKFENIFLRWGPNCRNGLPDIVLGDFGLSCHVSEIYGVCGTRGYLPPEYHEASKLIAMDRQAFDLIDYEEPFMGPFSDIFAFGVCVYNLISNDWYAHGETDIDTDFFSSHMKHDWTLLRILTDCLHTAPRHRLTANELFYMASIWQWSVAKLHAVGEVVPDNAWKIPVAKRLKPRVMSPIVLAESPVWIQGSPGSALDSDSAPESESESAPEGA